MSLWVKELPEERVMAGILCRSQSGHANRGRTQKNVAREATLFVLANLGGIAITQFCLLFTHHVLGLTSPLADNVAAYVVGFGLGTAFRFVFYHYIVFTGHKDRSPSDDDTDSTGPQGRPDSGTESPAVPISIRP